MSSGSSGGAAVLAGSGLSCFELADRGDAILLLLYRQEALHNLIGRPSARALLRRAGYGEAAGVRELLQRLADRIATGSFPHEVGVFLGYPLKDVAGFMGFATIPFACQGLGKSLALRMKASGWPRGSDAAALPWGNC